MRRAAAYVRRCYSRRRVCGRVPRMSAHRVKTQNAPRFFGAAFGLLAVSGCASTNGPTASDTAARAPVCTLSPAELDARRDGLIPGLFKRAAHVTKLENGYQMRFAARDGLLDELARVIEQERGCCSFLRFQITVEPENGPVSFDVTGPPGTREMLDRLSR